MNIEDIKQLISAVSDSGIAAFEYTESGSTLSLKKENGIIPDASFFEKEYKNQFSFSNRKAESDLDERKETSSTGIVSVIESGLKEGTHEVKPEVSQGFVVKCPLVGTVYTAPAEDAEPFVSIGDHVKKGQTLAIVEAMKLMNEVECEQDGVISQILVENGHMVEYGQEMFVIC